MVPRRSIRPSNKRRVGTEGEDYGSKEAFPRSNKRNIKKALTFIFVCQKLDSSELTLVNAFF
jgi:hypothetical protein